MARIELRGIHKTFAGGHAALAGIDLSVADGERLVLVGPSGSGKSTLLRIIAGLELPTAGRVEIDGDDVTAVPPERRDLAMVFQNYALYPHKTVRENLAFGLRMRRVPAGEIARRVHATAEALGIHALLERRPAQLSGGQRQRVALGRAMARDPRAFLFDEPLSNLDPRLRSDTRAELVQLHGRLGATMVYVTHDQEEAMTLGQRVAVMRAGAIEQVDAPDLLYRQPVNTFVAQFIGSPAMNLLADGDGHLGVRPHDIEIRPGFGGMLDGRVDVVEPLGHSAILHVDTPRGRVTAVVRSAAALEPGADVALTFDPARVLRFGRDGRRVP